MKEVPVLRVRLGGSRAVSVYAAGPKAALSRGVDDWSLRPFQRSGDEKRAPRLAYALEDVFWRLGTERVYAPRVADASARIVEASTLTERIQLRGSTLFRNQDVPADGVVLASGDAFAMSAAGCALIVASDGKRHIVAHAARNSLIDPAAVDGGVSREHMSVVDAIVDTFKQLGSSVSDIRMVILFAIPHHRFTHPLDHPVYGEHNRRLRDFVESRWPGAMRAVDDVVCLSLEAVFVQQAMRCGLGLSQVDATYPLGDKFPRLVHTRDGGDSSRRNLVVVRCE